MKKIIMVDDDTEILDVFRLVLERAGYSVSLFSKGDALLKNEFEEPDIFIIDKQLGGASGLDVCRYLKGREQGSKTPVIIFSASPHIDKQAREAGADDFLQKPFKTKALLELMEKHLNRASALHP